MNTPVSTPHHSARDSEIENRESKIENPPTASDLLAARYSLPATSSPRPLIYFGHVPAEGAGSAIIVYRHLRRFAEAGWDVRVVADWGQPHDWCRKHVWPVLELSHRKKFWPPFNPDRPLSRAFRAWLWAGEVRAWLGDTKPGAVFTYLSAFSDTLSLAAVGFARRYHLPLATIIHDDARDFLKSPDEGARAHARRQWIVENSTKAWFASPGLAACFTLPEKIIGVLPPIPEGATPASPISTPLSQPSTLNSQQASSAPSDLLATRYPLPATSDSDLRTPCPLCPSSVSSVAPADSVSEIKNRESKIENPPPLLIYAGNYWPNQLPVLAELSKIIRDAGGTLLAVLKENPEHVAYLRTHHVDWRAPFPKNTDALDYYRDHASAMVVSYARTSDDMPWTRTSFPSKLIEYCHLGLPLVIVAPEDTAIVQWARARNFPDVFSATDTASLTRYTQQLRDPAFRRDRAALSLSFARGEFNPATIQQHLVSTFSPSISE